MKYFVLADVHGFYTQMIRALRDAGYFDEQGECRLILCGDMMDRGEEACEMQRFMCEQLDARRLIFVRGNHEDLFESMITDIAYGRPISEIHDINGTLGTAAALAGLSKELASRYRTELATRVRETPFWQQLLPAAVDFFETPHYVFVHGWLPGYNQPTDPPEDGRLSCRPDWREADAPDWRMARWQNGMDCACLWRYGLADKTVVCGHWHASYGHARFERRGSERGDDADHTPFMAEGIIAIDGYTAHSGHVNCLVIED